MKWLSKLVDNASNFFAHRKGLLPLLGILLVIVNYTIIRDVQGGPALCIQYCVHCNYAAKAEALNSKVQEIPTSSSSSNTP